MSISERPARKTQPLSLYRPRGRPGYKSDVDSQWKNWPDLTDAERQEVYDLFGYIGDPILARLAWRRNPDDHVFRPRPGRSMARWSGDSHPPAPTETSGA